MQGVDFNELAAKAAGLILAARHIVVFTGAGVSTESGIADFRSMGGIWTKYNPDDFTYQKFLNDPEARRKNWQLWSEWSRMQVKPNQAHYAIAELERLGKLDCVITQNVDNLHQEAGSSPERVIELHGTMRWVRCLDCGRRYARQEIQARLERGVETLCCDSCHGLLKSATVAFGEAMPVKETREAEARSRNADLFIVIGSSLVVYPAAYMPMYAVQAGARLIIVNLTDTPMDSYADVVIRARAGEAMSAILGLVRQQA